MLCCVTKSPCPVHTICIKHNMPAERELWVAECPEVLFLVDTPIAVKGDLQSKKEIEYTKTSRCQHKMVTVIDTQWIEKENSNKFYSCEYSNFTIKGMLYIQIKIFFFPL